MFRLTPAEAAEVQRSRSQIVILKRGQNVKHRPLAFTEHGAIMAASVLNSAGAAEMSVFVVRAFVASEISPEPMSSWLSSLRSSSGACLATTRL